MYILKAILNQAGAVWTVESIPCGSVTPKGFYAHELPTAQANIGTDSLRSKPLIPNDLGSRPPNLCLTR